MKTVARHLIRDREVAASNLVGPTEQIWLFSAFAGGRSVLADQESRIPPGKVEREVLEAPLVVDI